MLTRRAALVLPLAAAACEADAPASFPPLTYEYLTPILLNVASISVEQRFVPGGRNDRTARSPVPPAEALGRMAHDRLRPFGAVGRAVFVITDASLTQDRGGAYQGQLGVELDILSDAGVRSAYAEARVFRRRDDTDGNERVILYELTRQMMDAMNVEFEFQVRRALKDYVTTDTAPPPAPVQAQPLLPPP